MPKALLFPGQGSQKIGMGKDLYDHSPMVRALFEEADDAVGKSLSDICFNGPKEALTQTENTQPALCRVISGAMRRTSPVSTFPVPISRTESIFD